LQSALTVQGKQNPPGSVITSKVCKGILSSAIYAFSVVSSTQPEGAPFETSYLRVKIEPFPSSIK
jgi:hypothetical protein